MAHRIAVAVMLAVSMVAVACGGSGQGPGSARDPEGTMGRFLVPTTTSIVAGDGPLATRVHPGSWRLVEEVATGRTLRVQVGFGGCTRFKRFEVGESADLVHVVALMESTILPAPDEHGPLFACTGELRTPIEEVHLAEPLGGRRLVGECSDEPPTCDVFPRRDGRASGLGPGARSTR